jgi:hypothetical protein
MAGVFLLGEMIFTFTFWTTGAVNREKMRKFANENLSQPQNRLIDRRPDRKPVEP